MAHKPSWTPVDRKILRLLATDGRSSYQALADEVGLSRPAVMERVKRWRKPATSPGTARAWTASKRDSRNGVRRGALHQIRLRRRRATDARDGKASGVLECHHVAGEDCYVLKVAAPDLERLQDLLRDLRRHLQQSR